MSWELFTKHLIREAAEGGTIAMHNANWKSYRKGTIWRKVEEEVIDVTECGAAIEENPPAPNAWVEGKVGYKKILKRIIAMSDKYCEYLIDKYS